MLFVVPDWAPAPSWSIKTPLPWTWNKTARADLQFIAKQKTAFNLWRGWGGGGAVGAIIGELSVIGQVAVVRVQHLVPCICRAGAGAGEEINQQWNTNFGHNYNFISIRICPHSPHQIPERVKKGNNISCYEKIKNELLLIENHSIRLSDYIRLSHHF